MKIQFNTDNHVKGSEKHVALLQPIIEEELNRFNHQITRIEVHLSDENGQKDSANDKRCVLEARLEGLKPFAATNNANTYEQAVKGAAQKLKAVLDSAIGKLNDNR